MTFLQVIAPTRVALTQLARGTSWALPGAVLALMPKCPMCFAATAALWTGVGLSLPMAAGLRAVLMAGCVGMLTMLVIRRLRQVRRRVRDTDAGGCCAVAGPVRRRDWRAAPPIAGTAETPGSPGNTPSGILPL